jgi:hypothetical protein
MSIYINLVFEDAISEFTMLKLLNSLGDKFIPDQSYPGHGYGYIKTNLSGFNQAAISCSFFVLADLDNHQCPIALKNDWLKKKQNPNLIFRVAVKEIESWLLADRIGFSDFTGVPVVNIPANPELENDPKQTLINVAKKSRKRTIREDIVPINNNAKIGPNYNDRLMQFVSEYWDIERAKIHSESLKRAHECLINFTYTFPNS